MAILQWVKNAVVGAVRWITSGRILTVTTREFWIGHGSPPIVERADVIDRANSVIIGQENYPSLGPDEPLGDIFGGTGYATSGPAVGPLETEMARIHGKAIGDNASGGVSYRSWSIEIPWDATKEEVADAIQDAIDAIGGASGSPNFRNGAEIPEETFYY